MAHTLANPLQENGEIKKQMTHPERPADKGCRIQKKFLGLILLIMLGLCTWSPWITQETASNFAETQFNSAWSGIIDGCGTAWNDLRAKDFRKVPFGATVNLEYQCGLVMPDEPPLQTTVFVSAVGTVHGFPKP